MSSSALNALTTGSYARLEWRPLKGLSRDAELSMDGRPIGTLTFRSTFGTFATAAIGHACWTFKRTGFLQPRVHVRDCGSDDQIAEFVNNTWSGGGTLTLPSGRTFKMTTKLWKARWEVEDAEGRVLLRFDYGTSFKMRARVKIPSEARAIAEVPLLVAFSWYLVVMLSAEHGAS